MNIIEFVNAKRLKRFGEYYKLPMKELTKSKILKLRFLLMIMKCSKMKPNESIVEMLIRFTDIVNGFEELGNKVSEEDKVSKIIRYLPLKYNSKTEVIEEAKNLKELPLEELIGSLMTYEMKIARQENEMQKERKKKNIALKAQKEKVVEETNINDMEDNLAFITKRVKNLTMNDKFGGRTYNKRSNYKKECPSKEEKEKREGASEVTCYKCKKSGHKNIIVLSTRLGEKIEEL